tara:strand:+ start:228 stop:467 length:240 start_codon:yes stop_codon:yes gene_type:complete
LEGVGPQRSSTFEGMSDAWERNLKPLIIECCLSFMVIVVGEEGNFSDTNPASEDELLSRDWRGQLKVEEWGELLSRIGL